MFNKPLSSFYYTPTPVSQVLPANIDHGMFYPVIPYPFSRGKALNLYAEDFPKSSRDIIGLLYG